MDWATSSIFGMSPSNITNYLAATRSVSIIHGCDTIFSGQRILLFVASLKINGLIPSLPLHLNEAALEAIIFACDNFPFPLMYKTLYLLCFSHF